MEAWTGQGRRQEGEEEEEEDGGKAVSEVERRHLSIKGSFFQCRAREGFMVPGKEREKRHHGCEVLDQNRADLRITVALIQDV